MLEKKIRIVAKISSRAASKMTGKATESRRNGTHGNIAGSEKYTAIAHDRAINFSSIYRNRTVHGQMSYFPRQFTADL